MEHALLGLLGLVGGLRVGGELLHADWSDAVSYAYGAVRFWIGESPYTAMQSSPYPLDAAAWGQGFIYPPPAAILLRGFAFGEPFWIVWNLVSVAALVYVAWRLLGNWGIPTGLVMASFANLEAGQTSGMMSALVGMMWIHRSAAPPVLGGLLKIFPLVGVVWTIRTRGSLWPLAIIPVALLLPYWPDWFAAWRNGYAGCPPWGLPSFTCIGVPWLGYVIAGACLAGVLLVRSDAAAFALLGVAMVAPAPDLYTGYLIIPAMAALPLVSRMLRHIPGHPARPLRDEAPNHR
jgi:hypothetical protein